MLATASASVTVQDGVIVQKIGSSSMFIFPGSGTQAVQSTIGKIRVGNNIAILYWLKIIKSNKARFIAFDSSKVRGLNARLTENGTDKIGLGFLVSDSSQKQLTIIINPGLIKDVATKNINSRIAYEGNLNVEFGRGEHTRYKIVRVTID